MAVVWALGSSGPAEARPNYPSQVPTPYGCETCHLDPNDRLNRNGFGIDFALERGLWVNPAQAGRGMCYLDSDFDGISNGEELGDPQCLWRPGTRLPGGPTTHPGDGRDPDQCGDGVIIPFAEECDRVLPEGESCMGRGYDEGELGCTGDCFIDESGCIDLPEPDLGPPDAAPPEPDAGPDAEPPAADLGPASDAMVDVPDAMDHTADAMAGDGDAMPDAILDDSDAMPGDSGAMADAMLDDLDAMPGQGDTGPAADDADGGCRTAPGRGGAAWPWLIGALAGVTLRRRARRG